MESAANRICHNSFAASLAKFKQLGKVPVNVIPEQFDDGSGNGRSPSGTSLSEFVQWAHQKNVHQNQTVTTAAPVLS